MHSALQLRRDVRVRATHVKGREYEIVFERGAKREQPRIGRRAKRPPHCSRSRLRRLRRAREGRSSPGSAPATTGKSDDLDEAGRGIMLEGVAGAVRGEALIVERERRTRTVDDCLPVEERRGAPIAVMRCATCALNASSAARSGEDHCPS